MLVLVGILRVLVTVALLSVPWSYAKVANDLAPLNQNSQAEAKLSAAIAARVQGRNDEARKSYEDARRLFQVERNRLGEANALLGLGELERKLGRNDEARTHYEDAQRLYQAERNRLGEANVLDGLGDLERNLGRNDEARRHYEDAQLLYQTEKNRLGEANVLDGLGDLERKLGRNEEARKHYEDARRLYRAERNQPGEANALSGLGDLERTLGRDDEARKHYEDARRKYEAAKDRSGTANALLGLGELERKLGRNDEARKLYEDARRLFESVQNRLGEANVLLALADLERVFARNDEARKHYEDARRVFEAVQNRLGEANVLLGLGDLERSLGRTDEARKRYEDALLLYQAVENRRGEAITLSGLGELERSLGRNDDARKNFRDAAIYFGLAGLPDQQREAQALSRFSDVRDWMAYRTRSGDRIEALAERFGTSVAALKSVNGIRSVAPTLPPGYHLLVPSDGSSEDALGSIPVSDLPGSSNLWWKSWQSWGAAALAVLGAIVALRWWQGRKRATSSAPRSATLAADAGKQWLHYRDAAATAVVFVHGILSNPSGFRFDDKTSWAELLHDDPRANEPNVFLGQYYTAPDTGIFDIPAASEELRVQLNSPTANGKPAPLTSERIVFIAHSTGGLVVRDLLTRHPELFKGKQVGLALIASPSRGSAWANRLSMFIDLANNRMARQLQKGNEWTDDLDKRFAEFEYKSDEARGFSIKGIDLFENRFVVGNYPIIRYLVPTRTVVVSERDSASYFGAGKIVPDTDHFSIAKPSSLEHASHRYLMEWWVRSAW